MLTEDGRLEQHPLLRLGIFVAAIAWFLLLRAAVERRIRDLRRAPEVHLDAQPDTHSDTQPDRKGDEEEPSVAG